MNKKDKEIILNILKSNTSCSSAYSGEGGCGRFTSCKSCEQYKTIHAQINEISRMPIDDTPTIKGQNNE